MECGKSGVRIVLRLAGDVDRLKVPVFVERLARDAILLLAIYVEAFEAGALQRCQYRRFREVALAVHLGCDRRTG